MNRDLFTDLKEGLDALAAERQGKVTLRKTKVRVPDPTAMTAEETEVVHGALQSPEAL